MKKLILTAVFIWSVVGCLVIVNITLLAQKNFYNQQLKQELKKGEQLDILFIVYACVDRAKRIRRVEWDRVEVEILATDDIVDEYVRKNRLRGLEFELSSIELRHKLTLQRIQLAYNNP